MSPSEAWRIRFGGVPTGADVLELLNRFGVPEEGKPIAYALVADVIGVKVKSNRFRTVTGAWRRMLNKEHGVLLMARDGTFSRMLPGQRIHHGSRKIVCAVRSIRRAGEVVNRTDRERLTEQEQKRADHLSLISAALLGAAMVSRGSGEAPQLPKGAER